MITIEDDVPVPDSKEGKFPFRKLQKGQSFVFPLHKINTLNSNARGFGKKQSPERKFVIRKISDTEARIWRIE